LPGLTTATRTIDPRERWVPGEHPSHFKLALENLNYARDAFGSGNAWAPNEICSPLVIGNDMWGFPSIIGIYTGIERH
jgi:hypothetical protein